MTELEKISYAKSFVDQLANGINPLDGTPIPENDIANNVRLSRCFFFVSDILRQVIENGGIASSKPPRQRKKAFCMTPEERENLAPSDRPLPVSGIADYLNSLVDLQTVSKISAFTISNWLLQEGLLETVTRPDGKNQKLPTAQGRTCGILTEERTGQYGNYTVVLYDRNAQQFIFDHIDSIIVMKSGSEDPLSGFHGRPWTEAHDESLKELYFNHVSVAEIAASLKRTEEGIRARLKKLGLIAHRSDAE